MYSPSEFAVYMAEKEIDRLYGEKVSVVNAARTLFRAGRNSDVGTTVETIWEVGGDETYVTTNAIDSISSSDNGDVINMQINGHTVTGTGADAKFTYVEQTVTLNGQTRVALDTPIARVCCTFVSNGSSLAGDVYVYENSAITLGVPNDITKVHNKVLGSAGESQSFKAATTIANTEYGIATGGYAAISRKQAAVADFILEIRPPGGVFRPAGGFISTSSTGSSTSAIQFNPYVIIPKNYDVRIRGDASATGVELNAVIQMYFANVRT